MSPSTSARALVALVVATLAMLGAVLASTVHAPPADAATVASSATLGPTQTADPDGTGTIALTLNSATGEVCYNLSASNIDPITAAHIHFGGPGTNGGVAVDFGSPIVLNTTTCFIAPSVAIVQAIENNPNDFYVNVHTTSFADGAIRAQVGAVTPVLSSTTQLIATGDPGGSGSIDMAFDSAAGQVCYILNTSGLATPITVAHIHAGAAGTTGAIVISLQFVTGQTYPKCVPATTADIDQVLADPSGHYVNVHTEGAAPGAIRGQVATPVTTSATTFNLDGLGFGDPDGSGMIDLTLDDMTGEVCFDLTVSNIDPITLAHIHVGASGSVGGTIVDFDPATNGDTGCVTADPADVASIIADPAGFYVNVHTASFPLGAIRGQLDATTPIETATPTAVATAAPTAAATAAPTTVPTAAPSVADAMAGPGAITNAPSGPAATGPAPGTVVRPAPTQAAAPAANDAPATTLALTGLEDTRTVSTGLWLLGAGLGALGAARVVQINRRQRNS